MSGKKSIALFLIAVSVAAVVVLGMRVFPGGTARKPGSVSPIAGVKAADCMACHEDVFRTWSPSHHAWANRKFERALDGPVFEPPQTFTIGSVTSTASFENGKPTLRTLGPGGKITPFEPDMILAHTPLRQLLVAFPGGRWQATELAIDPARKEWFNVYGTEDRKFDEWGGWLNRGMNWNSNCAFCHMTGFAKNYDIASDSYRSTWAEMGISCAQCHGAMPGHAETCAKEGYSAKNAPSATPRPPEITMENCASCHSRREELTGKFHVGERYTDHFRLTLLDDPRMYYPDGQIRDEVFVYASFRSSKMGHRGLNCAHCHDPHSGRTIMPAADNTLCMSCHRTGTLEAKIIDPLQHGHHAEGSKGNSCIECHMSFTTYMQRDPRRDHGFISPDPLLTRELGIPNACNKCHADQTTDWAIEWTEQWYGKSLDRPARHRTRLLARAQQNDATCLPELLDFARTEPNAIWRATLLAALSRWATNPSVRSFARERLSDPDADVRAAAVRALSDQPGEHAALRPLLDDESRMVRLDAAWALKANLRDRPGNRQELLQYLENAADQPSGAARLGQLAYSSGDFPGAVDWYRKAIRWDKYSAPLYQDLALMQNATGDSAGALETLTLGQEQIKTDPQIPFMRGLLLGEKGDSAAAERAVEEAVRIEPGFARAWYNLGLLRADRDRLDDAADALAHAVETDRTNPDYLYALATVELRRGNPGAAKRALQEALEINPTHSESNQLMRSIAR